MAESRRALLRGRLGGRGDRKNIHDQNTLPLSLRPLRNLFSRAASRAYFPPAVKWAILVSSHWVSITSLPLDPVWNRGVNLPDQRCWWISPAGASISSGFEDLAATSSTLSGLLIMAGGLGLFLFTFRAVAASCCGLYLPADCLTDLFISGERGSRGQKRPCTPVQSPNGMA